MSDLINYVYDRAIDYIENRASSNSLRREYARYMSAQNYNNSEMNQLVDVIAVVADNDLRTSRSSNEEAIVRDVIVDIVDSHVGAFGMSDPDFVDSAPDDIYTDMRRHEEKWNTLLARIQGRSAGTGRSSGGFGGDRRSVFERGDNRVVGSRAGSVFSRNEPQRDVRGSNSIFSRRPTVPQAEEPRASLFNRDEQQPRRAGFGQTAAGLSQGRVDVARTDTPTTVRQEPVAETQKPDGPDFNVDRPYDDFWVNGENWQLAHRSKFAWTWSPKQHTRRTYDPDQEVCFLVKGKDGSVREEFLAVTGDLVEYAHEIRNMTRPNQVRSVSDRESGDDLFPSNDLDVVDLDALKNVEEAVRKYVLDDLKLNSVHSVSGTEAVSSLEEAALQAAGAAQKQDEHITVTSKFVAVQLPADKETIKALDSIKALNESEADLLVLQKRLKTLRGNIAENVMNYLDKHYTDEVNRAVLDQFGLSGLKITSFVEDFEDLLNCGRFKKFGAGYAAQFLSRTRNLLLSLTPLTDEAMRMEFMECTDTLPIAEEDPEAYRQFRENVAVLFKPLGMVHVKVSSEEFGLVSEEVRTPNKNGAGAQPQLAEVLVQLYATARRLAGAGHIYMMTADNLCFELVAISGARDIVGIRLA